MLGFLVTIYFQCIHYLQLGKLANILSSVDPGSSLIYVWAFKLLLAFDFVFPTTLSCRFCCKENQITVVVERGLLALATIVQIWEGCLQDIDLQEASDHFLSSASSSRIFSILLQHAWLMQCELMEGNTSSLLPASSCLNDLSQLLRFVMRSVRSVDDVVELKLRELLVVWAYMIADWHD